MSLEDKFKFLKQKKEEAKLGVVRNELMSSIKKEN